MPRKQILPRHSRESVSFRTDVSVADIATVQVTSEEAGHPIDTVFTTLEREFWSTSAEAVTHLRLEIRPDEGGHMGRATLTSRTGVNAIASRWRFSSHM